MRRASSRLIWTARPKTPTAAQLTQVSMPPNCSTATSTTCATAASSLTSAVMCAAWPPAAVTFRTNSASAASSRATATTSAPAAAAIRAAVRPMPLEAPVMTMTCWFNGFRRTGMEFLRLLEEVG
jgi:hypothetical protein